MAIKRSAVLFFVLMMVSLSLVQAQANNPAPFDDLEVITPDNLDRLVKLRDLDSVDLPSYRINRAEFNADSTLLAGNSSGRVWVWSLETGQAQKIVDVLADTDYPFTFHPTDPQRLATCNAMWDVNTLKLIFKGAFCVNNAFDASGHFLVSDHPLSLLDANTGAFIRALPDNFVADGKLAPITLVCAAAFSPDGTKFAYTGTAEPDGEDMLVINIVDLKNGTVKSYTGSGDDAWMGSCWTTDELVFSADSRYLYSNNPYLVEVFDTENYVDPLNALPLDQLSLPSTADSYQSGFALTPDNQLLLCAFRDKEAGYYTIAIDMGKQIQIPLPSAIMNAQIAISPDGKLLAAYTDQISIWGVPSKEQ